MYPGEGFQILQLIVEERTGQHTTELMQTRVFDRFGMKNTSMVWRDDFAGRTTNHYDAAGTPLGHNQRRRPRAAGSMDAMLDDYAAFFAGVLRREGLSASSMDAVTGRTVSLAWQDPGDTSDFRLEVGFAPGQRALAVPLPTPASAIFANVPPGTYYVRVTAHNEVGGSPASNEVRVVVP